MIYIFDSSTLIDLFRHYYRDRFPSLWEKFDHMKNASHILSVREVFNEVSSRGDRLAMWAGTNREFFPQSDSSELDFVMQIFKVRHFQTLVRAQERLKGLPIADPFVIAKAKVQNGAVVTEEHNKPHGAKIPNVCEHFNIEWYSLEGFMEKEGWAF